MSVRNAEEKILSREAIQNQLEVLRIAGKKIVFTNGCFDLLHVGHVRYLQDAASEGDVLIVAINSDETITQLKGSGRPILPAAERSVVLASLACVDFLTVFDEETPHDLLRVFKPDVLVKGGDYGVEGIIGREVVWDYGGEVKPLSVTQGMSSSEIIERCRNV